MNKKKKGFTLVEVLVTLIIMGFVAMITYSVINVNRSAYVSLTYYAYNNLKEVVGEMMIPETRNGNQIITVATKGPLGFQERILRGDNGSFSFCAEMGAVVNTQGDVRCNSLRTENLSNFGNFSKPANPHFMVTNGQQYYFSKHVAGNANSYGYRIVFVDLNGDGPPNTIRTDGNLPPDIVAFLIVDNGEVLPIGVAANNLKRGNKEFHYISSKIYGYNFDSALRTFREDFIPRACINQNFVAGNGRNEDEYICNYSRELVSKENREEAGVLQYSFREGYCSILIGDDFAIGNGYQYCNDGNLRDLKNDRCPPIENNADHPFDVCKQELIKPLFRFNFK